MNCRILHFHGQGRSTGRFCGNAGSANCSWNQSHIRDLYRYNQQLFQWFKLTLCLRSVSSLPILENIEPHLLLVNWYFHNFWRVRATSASVLQRGPPSVYGVRKEATTSWVTSSHYRHELRCFCFKNVGFLSILLLIVILVEKVFKQWSVVYAYN